LDQFLRFIFSLASLPPVSFISFPSSVTFSAYLVSSSLFCISVIALFPSHQSHFLLFLSLFVQYFFRHFYPISYIRLHLILFLHIFYSVLYFYYSSTLISTSCASSLCSFLPMFELFVVLSPHL
jgi:hypothetical protein